MATAAAGADRFNAAMASEGAAGGGGDLGMTGKEMLDAMRRQALSVHLFALVLGHECLQHRPQCGLGLLPRCSLAFI